MLYDVAPDTDVHVSVMVLSPAVDARFLGEDGATAVVTDAGALESADRLDGVVDAVPAADDVTVSVDGAFAAGAAGATSARIAAGAEGAGSVAIVATVATGVFTAGAGTTLATVAGLDAAAGTLAGTGAAATGIDIMRALGAAGAATAAGLLVGAVCAVGCAADACSALRESSRAAAGAGFAVSAGAAGATNTDGSPRLGDGNATSAFRTGSGRAAASTDGALTIEPLDALTQYR